MEFTISPERDDTTSGENRVRVRMNWPTFEAVLAARGESSATRLTYLDGWLEIMSPSINHELVKTNLARLLELWALEFDVPLIGAGSFTIKKSKAEAGAEPDECYFLDKAHEGAPDLAIEVVWTAPLLDKLEVYRRLGVREVWVWQKGLITPWLLRGSSYRRARKSRVLPEFDLALLARFATRMDQHAALKAFRAALKRH